MIEALGDPASLRIDANGIWLVDPQLYAALPDNVRRLFAGLLAAIAGGRRFLPGDSERSRIERVLSGNDDSHRLTVFGALIERGENGFPHRFRREKRNLSNLHLEPGKPLVWDGRFRFSNEGRMSFDLAAPGRQELADFLKAENIEIDSRKRETLLVSPALYREGRLLPCRFCRMQNFRKAFISNGILRSSIMCCRDMILVSQWPLKHVSDAAARKCPRAVSGPTESQERLYLLFRRIIHAKPLRTFAGNALL